MEDLPRRLPAAASQQSRAAMSLRACDASALELAERGRGTTRPNPVVGAVVVADGEVVGEGWHERKGGPHAEVVALEAAGERARGATLYVTMEPCAHHGTTPPCTEAVLAAGRREGRRRLARPEPRGSAAASSCCASAGVEVEHADSFEARAQNEAWRTWIATGRAVRHAQARGHARRARDRARRAAG